MKLYIKRGKFGRQIRNLTQLEKMNLSEINAKLDELSRDFPPTSTGLTLALDRDDSLEDVSRNYAGMISRLKIWVESGHDPIIGKRLGYTNIVTL